jgi:hypothetical protein
MARLLGVDNVTLHKVNSIYLYCYMHGEETKPRFKAKQFDSFKRSHYLDIEAEK